MRWLVAYDVRSDSARARLAAWLGSHGVRRQRSVFECTITGGDLDGFIARCEELIDVDRDVVEVFSECDRCRTARVQIGQAGPDLDVGYWVVG